MAREDSPAYLWYPKDWLSSTRVALLELDEEGAYRRLLDHQWLNGRVPDSCAALARLCGTTEAAMGRIWKAIEHFFEPSADGLGGLQNARLEAIRCERDTRRKQKRDAGRKGGRTKADRLAEGKQKPSRPPSRTLAEGVAEPYLAVAVAVPVAVPSSVASASASAPTNGPAPDGASGDKRRVTRKPSGDVQEILSWFSAEYERTQGTPYVTVAKDAVGVARLLKVLPADEIRARLLRGLTTAEDDWIAGTDRGLALLVGQINKPALRGTAKPNGRDPKVGYAAPDDRSEFHQTRVVDL